jgi:hypothetical protein
MALRNSFNGHATARVQCYDSRRFFVQMFGNKIKTKYFSKIGRNMKAIKRAFYIAAKRRSKNCFLVGMERRVVMNRVARFFWYNLPKCEKYTK